MASLSELHSIRNDSTLINRLTVAVAVKAHSILQEDLSSKPARKQWAEDAMANPEGKAKELIWYVLADNAGVAKDTILAAGDTTVQTSVNNAVDKLRA